ncbi:MAG: hypothetical protein LBT76_04105 [Tannerella sp.]|nr:hypothetical protein [Tannerella sp.]
MYGITRDLLNPDAAKRYRTGMLKKNESLRTTGASRAPSLYESVQKRYGPTARTAIYKKYTIIYNIDSNAIWIRRVIASSLIT